MDVLHVPLTAAALLLLPSGATKIIEPLAAHRAMRAVGLPSRPQAVRALGAVEVASALASLLWEGRAGPVALAALYAGFAVFVLVALWRRAPLSSCGCFGADDTPPTVVHVGVDAALAAVGVLAATSELSAPLDVVADGGSEALTLCVGGALGALGLYSLLRWSGNRAARSIPSPR